MNDINSFLTDLQGTVKKADSVMGGVKTQNKYFLILLVVLAIGLLWYIRPGCILKNSEDSQSEIDYKKLLMYSFFLVITAFMVS